MEKAVRPAACPFGSHRSMDPPSVLPQLAWKLDASLPIYGNELLIRVETLNINPSSFSQLCEETGRDPEQLIRKICSIVSLRGKMHNPITGSGGTLMGTVAEIGAGHPAYGTLQSGDRICTLISLGLTPLAMLVSDSNGVFDTSYSYHGGLTLRGHPSIMAETRRLLEIVEGGFKVYTDNGGSPSCTSNNKNLRYYYLVFF